MSLYGLGINNYTDEHVSRIFNSINNYIYFYHLEKYYILPNYPIDTITDTSKANFNQETPLARSAPIYSYSSSGPRDINFQFEFHREMMQKINKTGNYSSLSDDYVDDLVKALQAAVVPNYGASQKLVDPPIVAVRVDNQIFIKGVCTSMSVQYGKPILYDGKYAKITVNFSVNEIDPYDAQVVTQVGSFRASNDALTTMNQSLARNTYSMSSSGRKTNAYQ